MTIRQARPSDVPAIAELHAESWRAAYQGILRADFLAGPIYPDRLRLWHKRLVQSDSKTQLTLLIEQAGELQAFACAFLNADPEWGTLLDNLHVTPRLKGKGLGRSLMSAIANCIVERRLRPQLHLWVFELNRPARLFYERLGGIVTACHTDPAPDGAHIAAVRYGWRDATCLLNTGGHHYQDTL